MMVVHTSDYRQGRRQDPARRKHLPKFSPCLERSWGSPHTLGSAHRTTGWDIRDQRGRRSRQPGGEQE